MSAAHEIIARLRVDGASDYTSSMEDAADATETFGDTTEETVERTSGAWDTLTENVNAISGALAGVGAFTEGFARSQAGTNATLGRAAIVTGESEESLRSMIDGMTDYTFSADDAVAGMERLIQSGVDSRDEFETILPALDTFSDATGIDMVDAIDSFDGVLSALGIPMTEVEDHLDTMTFLSTQTTVEMGALGRLMRNSAGDLEEYGMGTEDVAVAMAALEAEGIRGPAAIRAFQGALADGEGSIEGFYDALGVSQDNLDLQRERLEEANGMTEQFADVNNGTITPLQRLQANLQNAMVRYGGFADAAGMVAPIAMGAASGLQILTRAKGAAAVATRLLGGALTFLAANPIGIVIMAVAALVAAAIWLWNNWDRVSEWITVATEWLAEKVGAAIDWVREGPFGFLIDGLEMIWEAWQRIFDWISEKVEAVFGERGFVGTIRAAINAVIGAINGAIGALNSVQITLPTVPDWVPLIGGSGGQTLSFPQIPTLPTLNAGGMVPGGGPNRDSVLAALTPGEWVLNRDAAAALGPETLTVLNRLDRSTTAPAGGVGDVNVTVAVHGDVLDPQDWFRRNRKAMADSVGRAVADARAAR